MTAERTGLLTVRWNRDADLSSPRATAADLRRLMTHVLRHWLANSSMLSFWKKMFSARWCKDYNGT